MPNHDSTPEEVVESILEMQPNPDQIRRATQSLADLFEAAPDDPEFDLETWQRQWAEVESELKRLASTNDAAEGRGR